MSSTFGSLNTAASGLYAAQRGIDVTGQNVANANTDGYSRQRVDFKAIGAATVPAVWSTTSNGIGGGVNADTVTRIRDVFLEARAQTEHASSAQFTVENDAYTQIQQTFPEPSATGLQSQFAAMWSAWQDLANAQDTSAGSLGSSAGSQLLSTTQTVLDSLHRTSAALNDQWTQTQSNLQSVVTDVNSTAATIADLNQRIAAATLSGGSANELKDQRDALVMHLSEQIGATSQSRSDGSVDVVVGGVTLISGSSSIALAVAGPDDPNNTSTAPVSPSDPAFMSKGLPRIVTAVGHTVVTAGGTAGGQLNGLNGIIPAYRQQLDIVAQNLAAQVNAQQAAGYDASGAAGPPIFGSTSGPITAATITLLIDDPSKLAASAIGPDGSGTPAINGGNADAISQLGKQIGSPDNLYRAMITQLGVQAQAATRSLDTQTTVASTVDANREAVSGVSIDEEMTNMLAFQHAYSASARLITAIDQNLDTLINHMGLVGNA